MEGHCIRCAISVVVTTEVFLQPFEHIVFIEILKDTLVHIWTESTLEGFRVVRVKRELPDACNIESFIQWVAGVFSTLERFFLRPQNLDFPPSSAPGAIYALINMTIYTPLEARGKTRHCSSWANLGKIALGKCQSDIHAEWRSPVCKAISVL